MGMRNSMNLSRNPASFIAPAHRPPEAPKGKAGCSSESISQALWKEHEPHALAALYSPFIIQLAHGKLPEEVIMQAIIARHKFSPFWLFIYTMYYYNSTLQFN